MVSRSSYCVKPAGDCTCVHSFTLLRVKPLSVLIIIWEVIVFQTTKRNYSEGVKACMATLWWRVMRRNTRRDCEVNRQFSALSRLMKLFDLHVIPFKTVSIGSYKPFHTCSLGLEESPGTILWQWFQCFSLAFLRMLHATKERRTVSFSITRNLIFRSSLVFGIKRGRSKLINCLRKKCYSTLRQSNESWFGKRRSSDSTVSAGNQC